jgi:hypothetical protein
LEKIVGQIERFYEKGNYGKGLWTDSWIQSPLSFHFIP